jgi:uncharacterized metal-binding protein
MSQQNCAGCPEPVCQRPGMTGKQDCPTEHKAEAIKHATEKMHSPEFQKWAYAASIQEGQGFMKLPFAPKGPSPVRSRLEETVELARKMGFRKLGVAYCLGVRQDAGVMVDILQRKGFEVASVCCKCGAVSKAELGIKPEEQVWPAPESMCHPIAQAEILNEEQTDFNILMCLCVGHDTLFLRNSQAPCTVFAVKDRLFAHNPMAALWLRHSYHRRVLSRE